METNTLITVIAGVLFGISEALSFIPSVASNGVFQSIYLIIKKLAGR